MNLYRRDGLREESRRGSALVAAMGVAVIGLMLSLVVVSVSIVSTRDAARDRVRTIEIHAAEAVVDQTLVQLQFASPCDVDPQTIGEGMTSVDVTTEITYVDEDGVELTTCSDGEIVGTPVRATIRSTAVPTIPQPGLQAERSIEAVVNIKPVEEEVAGSAIFSAGAFSTGAGFSMSSLDPSDHARVWIDTGDWQCNTSITIDGDLVVAQGKVRFANKTCAVTGNVWAKTGFEATSTPSATYSVGGDLTVYAGPLELANKNRFGGDVSIGGDIKLGTQWSGTTVAGTVCANNVGSPCTNLTLYNPTGLPEINYIPSDWSGFTVETPEDFAHLVMTSWGIAPGDWKESTILAQPCSPPTYMTTTPIEMPHTPTIFDMRKCNFGQSSGGGVITLKVYTDTVFFSESYSAPNGLTVISGDGDPHTIYFIVPDVTPGDDVADTGCANIDTYHFCPGSIQFTSGGIQVQEPMQIFLYTPGDLKFPNTSNTRGQMYAGSVTIGAGSGVFKYDPVPLPGGYLTTISSETAGYNVEIVGKRES